jgi:hypothetical protein
VPADVEYWPTPDVTVLIETASREEVLAAYRGVRDNLFKRIKDRFLPSTGGPSV